MEKDLRTLEDVISGAMTFTGFNDENFHRIIAPLVEDKLKGDDAKSELEYMRKEYEEVLVEKTDNQALIDEAMFKIDEFVKMFDEDEKPQAFEILKELTEILRGK